MHFLVKNGAEYAQQRLFSSAGINPKYNMWNATGDALIDPSTGTFNSSVGRRYDPEVWRDYAFNDARRNEVNLVLVEVVKLLNITIPLGP